MESIWSKDTKIKERSSLPGDLRIHTVVIGGGMAGILTAYNLQKAGVPVIVLEADRVGSGQTKNTTAKITSQHGLIYDRLVQMYGYKLAEQYARANERAIKAYETIISDKEIDCQFTRCPAYLYSKENEKLLMREAEAAEKAGIQAEYTSTCDLPFSVAGAVKFHNQAKFHPLKFLYRIAEEVTVYERTKALKVADSQVVTDRGTVWADKIVFACHFPFVNVPGYYFARMYQERSYVIALKNAVKPEGMYIGIDENKLSLRCQGDLLLLGGGGHRTGRNGQGGGYGFLRRMAKELWPESVETACWSAQDCMTLDGIPYIGRFSAREPDWYVASGFGKWGMTSSMVSADIITAMITGRSCPEAEVFSPQRRINTAAVQKFAGHSAQTAVGLGKRLIPVSESIQVRGEVIQKCPHMGCRLEWNPEEQSYDCPCHGSRFDKNGKLIDGPAQKDCQCRQ